MDNILPNPFGSIDFFSFNTDPFSNSGKSYLKQCVLSFTMRCNYCGKEVSENDDFCKNCVESYKISD